MAKEEIKVIEKHYIEVTASYRKRFLMGILQGLGWGIGITLATSLVIAIISYFVSRIDFVPVFGQFLNDVIKTTQQTPKK